MTNSNNFNTNKKKLRILICPLDWGLGHATRCIPIIKELLSLDCEVFIAADGKTMNLLKEEFPSLTFLQLQGYNITYAKNKSLLKWKMFIQIPKIFYIIIKEHAWLKKAINTHNINAVISDNRFGLFNKNIKTVYITHQLQIKTGTYITDRIAQIAHYFFIARYNVCWVPDAEIKGLGGDLSHPSNVPANVKYLGPLSRFFPLKKEILYKRIFVLSGPEPQRTILEKIIVENTYKLPGKNLLIRGTDKKNDVEVSYNCQVKDLVSAKELNDLIVSSEWVISRSGYSTVMDLAKLQKKALLIPTPGQTEQEYLAGYLMQNNLFCAVQQSAISDLIPVFENLHLFPFETNEYDWENYKVVVKDFIAGCKK